jgi:hypothetical protein
MLLLCLRRWAALFQTAVSRFGFWPWWAALAGCAGWRWAGQPVGTGWIRGVIFLVCLVVDKKTGRHEFGKLGFGISGRVDVVRCSTVLWLFSFGLVGVGWLDWVMELSWKLG